MNLSISVLLAGSCGLRSEGAATTAERLIRGHHSQLSYRLQAPCSTLFNAVTLTFTPPQRHSSTSPPLLSLSLRHFPFPFFLFHCLSSRDATMFKAVTARAPMRAALRSSTPPTSLRVTPQSTSLLQTRISQRRGYATPAGKYCTDSPRRGGSMLMAHAHTHRGKGPGHHWGWSCWICRCYQGRTGRTEGRLHRKAWSTWRNMSQRRLHSLEIASQQLAALPPDPARHEKPRH